MPTFTGIPLENLLEPRVRDTPKKPVHWGRDVPDPLKSGSRHLYISPALYATPHQAPIPDNSLPYPPSPSPYVVNLKRRRAGNVGKVEVPELPSGNEVDDLSLEAIGENFVDGEVAGNAEAGEEEDGFINSRSEGMGVGSEVDATDFGTNQIESRSFVSTQGEFFDAIEDFFTDGSVSNTPTRGSRIESELHATKLSLLEEIEKRRNAEMNLVSMHNQWERIRSLMSEAGLTFPALPVAHDSIQPDNNFADQISLEVVIGRFVAEAIGRGQARAEAEAAALSIIEMKDQEILRLRDKLQYYETVNHEMSQRKLVEAAQRQQQRKNKRRRWLWSLVGLSITIGASFAAYQYFPEPAEIVSFLKSADSTGASEASVQHQA